MEQTRERYSRQILFPPIGPRGQEKLAKSKVLIVGLGALGSTLANNLARAGIGSLRLVDRDFVEESNLQRQILFDEQDAALALPKAVAAANKLRQINSQIHCEAVVEDVNFTNIEKLMAGMDLVLDGTDNLEIRYLINEACVKLNTPWVYGACVGSTGMTMTVIPRETPCLECVFPSSTVHPGETCDTAGIINPVPNVIASLQTAEALKLLVGARDAVNRELIILDLWENSYITSSPARNPACSVCVQGSFRYLAGEVGLRTTNLCGRNAVQVVPDRPAAVDLAALAEKLQPLGEVSSNGFLVTFRTANHQLVVFGDGRAIVKGTDDVMVAKTLYARFVGA